MINYMHFNNERKNECYPTVPKKEINDQPPIKIPYKAASTQTKNLE